MNNIGLPILGKMVNLKDFLPFGIKVVAHWMPWFGHPSHKNVPSYDSRDRIVCAGQCTLMKSMGIDAINVDWYGPDHIFENTATLHMLEACEELGLGFSICVDKGALAGATALPYIFQYILQTYVSSDSYLKDKPGGKPILNFFGDPGIDLSPWANNFSFLFQDAGGFSHAFGSGAFGWVHPVANPLDMNSSYLADFVAVAAANPQKTAWFPIYPGFDDSQASWGSKRLMSRRAGLTLLDCLSYVPSKAQWALVVTWNDHEEGSAIELSQG